MPALIEDYALVGDGHTAALVAKDGSVDWLCWPRFDSGACFAALLGTPEHGRWLLAPAADAAITHTSRRYRGDTLILETDYESADGAVTVVDFMPPGNGWSELVPVMPGKGNVIRTGSLGDVMKESVEAARSVVRSRSRRLGIKDEAFEKQDIHIHVPEGATPKDGPSAGGAMTTALVSVLTGIPVRADVAMTGEITLRGEVLPIGGLKEKLLAAHRGGIKLVLIPEENVKDLAEIPDNVKNAIEIVPVRWIDKVLELALERSPTPLPPEEEAKAAAPVADAAKDAGSTEFVKH